MGETEGMAYEVLSEVRQRLRALGYSDNGPAYDALREIAPALSCWQFGHPEQPRWFLRRFRQRPWRCARCGTWWITEPRGTWGAEWEWAWRRVEAPDAR